MSCLMCSAKDAKNKWLGEELNKAIQYKEMWESAEDANVRYVNDFANAKRLIEWLEDPKRKPANTAFTEGMERQLAYRFERLEGKLKVAVEAFFKFGSHQSPCVWEGHTVGHSDVLNDPSCSCGGDEILDQLMAEEQK